MPNFKPAFIMRGESKPCTNGEVYATREEALASAHQRFMVWTMPDDFTAVETDDPVNGRWENGRITVENPTPRVAPEQVSIC